jgi:hypothetical protein
MKAKLRAENCNTLYYKAIEYKATNLNKIIKSNQLDEKHKFNACVYTTLIKMYSEIIKINKKNMTYNNLFKYFNNEKYSEDSDLSLSIEQLKKFFEDFKLSCTLLNGQNQIFYEYKADKEVHRKNAHFKAMW